MLDRTTTVIPVDEGRSSRSAGTAPRSPTSTGTAAHPEPITVDWDVAQAQKGGYDSFMRKEIDEQPAAIRDTLVGRVVGGRLCSTSCTSATTCCER